MEEIREILQTIAQGSLATTSAAEAVKKAGEDNKSSTTGWSRLIAKPNIFDYKSQEEEIQAFREWSWVFEKYLSAVDEGYVKDLKEIREAPNEKFDMDLATRCIKLYVRGRALQLVKAVENSNGFDAWKSLNNRGQHFQ